MPNLCTMSDCYIQNKIRTGEWIPSLDTGEVYSNTKKGFLKPTINHHGYKLVSRLSVSHIIWVAANGPVPYGMQIDHINGNKQDNRLCNLHLVTASENQILTRGVLTFAQAQDIRKRYAECNITQRGLAKEYHVSPCGTLESCIHRARVSILNNIQVFLRGFHWISSCLASASFLSSSLIIWRTTACCNPNRFRMELIDRPFLYESRILSLVSFGISSVVNSFR